jgi:bifunctional dethiobiotin synthetase / adenosylmethionine---8-amino-7-oxononanoate aminotransferase
LDKHNQSNGRYAVVETAGGVLSPTPSGSLQAELYRELRLPTILVGDSKLGGIASTISAFESLHVRGYDVDSVVLFDDPQWGNYDYLHKYFTQEHGIETFPLAPPPPQDESKKVLDPAMMKYYEDWTGSKQITNLLGTLNNIHFQRVSKLTSLPAKAESIIWHPFRQHALSQNLIAIDSAYGDYFEVYNQETDPNFAQASSQPVSSVAPIASGPSQQMLKPLFDASASWWTQGLGHGNPELALTAAHAAGRYGHVMFANAVHEPALDLCYNLLEILQNPRLSRVFFTDNGSTGMEVAVKIALRASCQRYDWNKADTDHTVGILGLKGSYHGDTIGVMNCSEPNVYNEKVDWYKPWGYWFDPPQVLMRKGRWEIDVPSCIRESTASTSQAPLNFDSLSSVFDFHSRPDDANLYKSYITRTLRHLTHDGKRRFGALIIEPIIMGAGGMIFVDPLFQRTLITTIREDPSLINPSCTPSKPTESGNTDWSGLPLIADEVFTGLYRLGRSSSSSFLSNTQPFPDSSTQPLEISIAPDISVHAKLLTGGLLPLAVTTASTSIFNTFLSPSKTDALLHGHSYTAHPIGCAVANKSLKEMTKLSVKSKEWEQHRSAWSSTAPSTSSVASASGTVNVSTTSTTSRDEIFSFFHPAFLTTLSHHPLLSGCFALGTVLALTMTSPSGSGYNSTATATLQSRLLTTLEPGNSGIHARVLGDVIYIMTSLTTTPKAVREIEGKLMVALNAELEARERGEEQCQ